MRRPKPSLFATISLLVLLALGVAANLHIAHQKAGKPKRYLHSDEWFVTNQPSAGDQVAPGDWPSVPEHHRQTLGKPTRWTFKPERTHRLYELVWEGTAESATGWGLYYERRFGWPMTVRAVEEMYAGDTFGSGLIPGLILPTMADQVMPPATTYHPLGLISNPIAYALPLWIVLLLLRHTLIRYRSKRRTAKGQCPHCAYDLTGTNAQSVCPECGHPNLTPPQPVSA